MAEFPPVLLAFCPSKRKVAGRAMWVGQGEETKFGSASELAEIARKENDACLLVCGIMPDTAKAYDLVAAWPGSTDCLWFADDALGMFSIDAPGSLADLRAGWQQFEQCLAEVDDSLLSQCVKLAAESGEQARLGFLSIELLRRHDALSMPKPGDVGIAQYFPPEIEGGPPPRQEVPTDILEQVFEAKEKLKQAFTAYEERPQQIEMTYEVELALKENRPLIVEAGTGVGKSLAYLMPLAVYSAQTGKLCLVSTNTINLQQQLVDLDIPRLRQILDNLDLRITLLKGREHYLCLKRMEDLWLRNAGGAMQRRERFIQGKFATAAFAIKLLIAMSGTQDGDLDTISGVKGLSQSERNATVRSIDCGFATCIGDRCEYKGKCHFFNTRNMANTSHIVIANHALVFALYNPDDENADSVVAKASVIVFDEAHNLESAITNQKTLEVDEEAPVELGNRLLGILQQETCRKRMGLNPGSVGETVSEKLEALQARSLEVPGLVKLAAEIRAQVQKLLEQASNKNHLSTRFPNQLTPSTATDGQVQVMDLLEKLAQRFLAVINRYTEVQLLLLALFCNEDGDLYLDDVPWQMDVQSLGVELRDAGLALAGWKPRDEDEICWFNADLSGFDPSWDYKTAPLNVGPIFQSLIQTKECVILSSATLSTAGSFEYLQSSLGFSPAETGRARWLKLDSPFDYQKQALLLVATDMHRPTGATRDSYLGQLEEVVVGVCKVFKRGVLVLFNSYRDLQHIADAVDGQVDGARILVQGRSGSRSEIAHRFRDDGDKVLFATRSFWEGFDVSGSALSCVVLAKLPFANFKDPIHAGRQRAIKAAGGDSFRNYSLPLAAMQLKQGFGRLVRNTTDYGCVFLLDSRVANSNYGKVFLDSLPDPKTFMGGYGECIEQASAFMEQQGG